MIPLRDVLFYGGGDCMLKFGTLSWRTSPGEDNPETHTRTAGATFVGKAGYLRQAAANTPRVEWLDLDDDGIYETPVYLGEPSRTNLVTSDNFDGGWISTNSPVVTPGIDDPAGGTAAYRVADDDVTVQESKYIVVSFTGDGVKVVKWVVREATMASSGNQQLVLHDATASAQRANARIDGYVAGKPTVVASAGTLMYVRYVGNGYWEIAIQSTTVTAANTHRLYVYPAATVSATGSIDVYRAMAFNAQVPPASVLDASQVLGADALSFPFPHKRQGMALYADFYWRDVMASAGAVLHIGSATAATDPRIVIQSSGSYFQAVHDNGTTTSTATLAAAPAYGDRVELLATVDPDDGSVTLSQSLNQAAATTVTDATAVTLTDPFAGQLVYIGSAGSTGQSIAQYRSAKIVRWASGDTAPTMADMRALFG